MGGSVGAIEEDAAPGEIDVTQAGVPGQERSGDDDYCPRAGLWWVDKESREVRGVMELLALGIDDLQAVVLPWVVTGCDHDAAT